MKRLKRYCVIDRNKCGNVGITVLLCNERKNKHLSNNIYHSSTGLWSHADTCAPTHTTLNPTPILTIALFYTHVA